MIHDKIDCQFSITRFVFTWILNVRLFGNHMLVNQTRILTNKNFLYGSLTVKISLIIFSLFVYFEKSVGQELVQSLPQSGQEHVILPIDRVEQFEIGARNYQSRFHCILEALN